MSKLEYIDALRRALTGLPPDMVAKTLAYYEQYFIDGLAVGHGEAEIANDLGDPKKIALTLRANTHVGTAERRLLPAGHQPAHRANLPHLLVSLVGLGIFNLFMVIPAMVYSALLAVLYVAALSAYVGGIAITASGLSGANELVLDGPLRHVIVQDDKMGLDHPMQTRVSIGENSIQIYQEAAQSEAHAGQSDEDGAPSQVIKRAEAFAGRGVHISSDPDGDSRGTQTSFGLAMVFGGICLFLLSLVVTKYTVIGIKRYIGMNFSLLRAS
ncbi:putative membrane protein [Oxalobacteraceae bacterium GrIS 1.11]